MRYPVMTNKLIASLAAALSLSACAAPAYVSPVEVTRFVGDTPAFLGQGTIELVAAPGNDADSLEFSVFHNAVRQELEQLGYRVVAQNGEQIAQLSLEQFVLQPGEGRGPVNVGVGGSTGSYGSGMGVGIGLDLSRLGGPDPDRIDTLIAVTIRQAAGGQNLWEGRAGMTATTNSDFAGDAQVAARIADALFADFPGISGETIAVE